MMRRLTAMEIIRYLEVEVREGFSRADLKYHILGEIDESALGLQENIEEKIDVISNLKEIIDIVLFSQGNKEEQISMILSKYLEEYIEDEEMNHFKRSSLVLELIEKSIRVYITN